MVEIEGCTAFHPRSAAKPAPQSLTMKYQTATVAMAEPVDILLFAFTAKPIPMSTTIHKEITSTEVSME